MDLEDLLGQAGYETRWVATLQSALQSITANRPMVAIVDLKLLDGDAAELIHALKRQHIPFIVHSAFLDHEVPGLHGVPWVPKPAEASSILHALEAVLSGTPKFSVAAIDHSDPSCRELNPSVGA